MFLILKTVNFVGKKTIEKSISDFDLLHIKLHYDIYQFLNAN